MNLKEDIIKLCEQIQNDEVSMTEYQLASTIKQLLKNEEDL